MGTTRNQAVPIRANWGCPLVQRGAQRVPYQTPSRGSLAPSAGLAVAGPVIWRRATVARRRNSEDYEEALATWLASG